MVDSNFSENYRGEGDLGDGLVRLISFSRLTGLIIRVGFIAFVFFS